MLLRMVLFYLGRYCQTGYERLYTREPILKTCYACTYEHSNMYGGPWSPRRSASYHVATPCGDVPPGPLEPSKKCFSPCVHSEWCCASWSPGALEEVLLAMWPLNVALCLLVPWSPRRTILMTCCESYHCLHLLLLSCLFGCMNKNHVNLNSRIQEFKNACV